MSQSGERTERATPKKRRDAREKGQVLKSTEVNTALSLVCMFGALKLFSGYIGTNLYLLVTQLLDTDFIASVGDVYGNHLSLFVPLVTRILMVLLPIMAVALVVGLVSNYMQVGFIFNTKALMPKFSRINPAQGFKRIFSIRSVIELVKSILKVAILGKIVYDEYQISLQTLPSLLEVPLARSVQGIAEATFNVGLKAGIALLLLAAADFLYQWWQHEKDLRMTKQEVKDEYKMLEGDPQIKSKIRQRQREMGMMRMMQGVPSADVVITNPTHYAVALSYDEDNMMAPTVIAKGKDLIAKRIREIATENGVRIIEDKPVAQGLYFYCEIGETIPEDMYQAVAEILALVYRARDSA